MKVRPTLGILAVFALPACISEEGDDAAPETVAAAKVGCGDMVCGNAGEIDDQPFWELDESKVAYSPVGGFRIKNFKLAGADYHLVVNGYNLIGVPVLGGPNKQGTELLGATIDIEAQSGAGPYRLTITGYAELPQHEDFGWAPTLHIPAFKFEYTTIGRREVKFLCPTGDESMFERMAIVSQGDRYTADGQVTPHGGPWFNIACTSSALWKLAEFRYTEPTADAAHVSDATERKVILQAIMADYCGIGHSFTVLGTDVDWANDIGSLWFNVGYTVPEALWKPDGSGAACLTKPRLVTKAEVGAYCNIPNCTAAQMAGWQATYPIFTKVKP